MRVALKQLKNSHDLVGAEIGVFHGNFALIYLEYLDIKKVYLIDPYEAYEGYEMMGYNSSTLIEKLREAEKEAHIKLDAYKNKIKWIKATSAIASTCIDDESLDFVYIDGSHEHDFVLQDITLYYPKVKKGGLLSGHDYGRPSWPGLSKAVNNFCMENNLKLNVKNYDWWAWKQ